MKYTKGRTKVPSGKFEKLYREEMRTLVLYRLMVLILFLDHLKMKNVLDKVPRLFTKSSEVKSSKAVLLSFCRNFLSSEGDFMKHLSRIGLEVSYVQDPIDELEFKLSNLAADLRDGGNLTRMTEIITDAPFKTLMRSLRLPAVSRLQKMHNVGVALTKLKDFGIMVPQDLNAHHIVDAHREMVLKLMWSVIAHVCMNKLLNEEQVAHEIENVLRSGKARRNMEGIKARSSQHLSPDKPTNSSSEETLRSLLFRWCKAVCSNFGLHLQDFTDSFANGKALCYLVHYYHPGLLRCEDILPTLNDEDAGLSEYQALANERANSALASKCVTELGGIPKMLPITDSRNPPDEKSMLLCLAYLCSRLMESSEEIFATILIQACYRRYRNKVLQEQKEAAARVIFRAWCDHKDQYYVAQQRRYAEAVAVVETFVLTHRHGLERMKLHRLKRERQIAAITLIQVRISATVLPSVDFLPSANPRKWLEMLSRNDWPRNIHKSSPTGTICDHDSEALSTIHC
jgi:abnormal spindle-like microcephaly-associated protein